MTLDLIKPEPLPLDVQKQWYNIARRLQSVAKTGGLALLTITILVDETGSPRAWLEPTCRKIEPRRSGVEILAALAASDGNGKF